MKKIMAAGIILSVLGMVLALVPQFILPVCDTMVGLPNGNFVPMGCHYMGIVVTMGGILAALTGFSLAIIHSADAALVLGIWSVVDSFATVIVSIGVIGTCKNAKMPCRMGTQPAVLLLCALITIVGAVEVFWGIKRKKGGV
ncbi:MAG: DUF4418 family protein [Lachnospiraceae bacterium]|nr:DUF4418 family protein [Lachnospiraceae bacterium]MDE6185066.1 DUF4418 family protein [Lachnospiraceae bacterium]